jgi:hypothetical protein
MVKPMKSANATFGRTLSKKPSDQRAAAESQTRPTSMRSAGDGADVERGHWARCEQGTPPAVQGGELQSREAPSSDEPRTGVIRRADAASTERKSGVVERPVARRPSTGKLRPTRPRGAGNGVRAGDWRCLEWGQPSRQRRMNENPKVTIAQLSQSGELLRQNGPAAWLPEAADFMHRMARLVAQGLGKTSCRSLCLRSTNAVLTVTEASESKVIAVSGPMRSMTNVLRRAGLE